MKLVSRITIIVFGAVRDVSREISLWTTDVAQSVGTPKRATRDYS